MADDIENTPLIQRNTTGPRRLHFGLSSSTQSRLSNSRKTVQRFLKSTLGHYFVLALVSLDVACIIANFVINSFTCGKPGLNDVWYRTLNALGVVSLVFSCLFMVELFASVWAFGLRYFKSKFHVLDSVVIITGFVVDVMLHGVLEEVASLVVVLRLWRVFKIIEELTLGAQEQAEGLQEQIGTLKKENEELKEQISHFESNNRGHNQN